MSKSNIYISPETLEPLSLFFAAALTWFKETAGKIELHGQRVQIFCATDIEAAKQQAIEAIEYAYLKDQGHDDLPTSATIIIIPIHTYIEHIVKGEPFYEDQPITEINLTQLLHNFGQ